MKTVYIVRHGKAIHATANVADADRLLTDTGVARTCRVALYVAESKPVIDQIISSPAERAYATALIIADKLGYQASNIKTDEKLFTGDDKDTLDIIAVSYTHLDVYKRQVNPPWHMRVSYFYRNR